MFGLSIGKVLIVVAAVGAIVIGSKVIRQMSNSGRKESVDKDPAPENVSASDLIQCPTCGAYAARHCGKQDCPLT